MVTRLQAKSATRRSAPARCEGREKGRDSNNPANNNEFNLIPEPHEDGGDEEAKFRGFFPCPRTLGLAVTVAPKATLVSFRRRHIKYVVAIKVKASRLCSSVAASMPSLAELWHTTLADVKSMALKCALNLRIADAIQLHGGGATLPKIIAKVTLHPSKIPCLRRLMRVLSVTGIFNIQQPANDGGEQVYGLTPASQLLVGASNLTPLMTLVLDSISVCLFLDLGAWFQRELPDLSLFEMKHGQSPWDFINQNSLFGALFNEGMVSDCSFIMDIVIKECDDVFQGISSLIDVAGGLGGAAQAIAKAFPHVKCSVLDLPQVVASAPASTNVKYTAGDMFESIPSANAVFLKDDAECVKILKNCKKSISPRDAGGKIIILDMVVGGGKSNLKHQETQVLFDFFIMFFNGVERNEQGWKKIIFEAGFSDYKIMPILGVRSIIEVYP
ncbi:O-methyltransferase ZRP4-like [Phragmites australis]|uniref:O-methyltransferase ZRP4-like n=1 Tax=Phragmites australis TaxID=29695 RepID=UPI002D76AB8A|nr:O-methyltransferase ZRP4-like [Phragmites australis]